MIITNIVMQKNIINILKLCRIEYLTNSQKKKKIHFKNFFQMTK